ncbi:M16 family metallopeptidase [Candidatus Latescibacterota bacterium]
MNKLRFVILLILTFNTVFISEALALNKTELPNGLVIITKPVKTNSIVSFVVTMKMGSLYETDVTAGLCAIMQDTLRKGTRGRTSEQIALELESMGTRLSTYSSREHGTVEIESTSDNIYKSIDILYDIMLNPTFPEDSVELQKKLQIRSILTRYDQPIYLAMDLMIDAHYGTHPFHKPRAGYPEAIEKLSRDEIVEMHNKIYVPNNMVITVVGNFDEQKLIANITDNLGSLSKSNEMEQVEHVEENRLARSKSVEKIETRKISASWFFLGWEAPVLNDPESFPMEILDSITGGSVNSRLFVAIREERGLAYQVASSYDARKESGIYFSYIGTKPESYEESKKVLIDEISMLASEEPTAEEILFAKNYLKGMNTMSQESNSGQASQYGYFELLGNGYEYVNEYNEKIDEVTGADILNVGKKYLNSINYALGGVIAE